MDRTINQKELKDIFYKIVSDARSSHDVLEMIGREPEFIRPQLIRWYEQWRTGENIFLSDTERILGVVIGRILFVSPLVGIVLRTFEALHDGYQQTYLIQDPGHRRIQLYDAAIVGVVFIASVYLVVIENDFSGTIISVHTAVTLLFPQFSGWVSFFVLYGISFLLFFYDKNRSKIIRRINELKNVW
ncbi:MAG: hypothetical protein Q8P56_05825 [Candidatus Uhrbacteria bacterium]|nr:hypothetical protein [Candidatus Uhrbacteria bacterium]